MRDFDIGRAVLGLLAILLATGGTLPAWAQQSSATMEESLNTATDTRRTSAAVIVFNRQIVEFRYTFLG